MIFQVIHHPIIYAITFETSEKKYLWRDHYVNGNLWHSKEIKNDEEVESCRSYRLAGYNNKHVLTYFVLITIMNRRHDSISTDQLVNFIKNWYEVVVYQHEHHMMTCVYIYTESLLHFCWREYGKSDNHKQIQQNARTRFPLIFWWLRKRVLRIKMLRKQSARLCQARRMFLEKSNRLHADDRVTKFQRIASRLWSISFSTGLMYFIIHHRIYFSFVLLFSLSFSFVWW